MSRFRMRPLFVAVAVALLVPSLAQAAGSVVVADPLIPSFDRISWSAVLAGAVVALAVHLGLSMLGIGFGAATVDPQNRKDPVNGAPMKVLFWMFISGLIALFAGGWISGRLAGTVPFDSTIHGVIVWAIATVMLVILATTSVGAVAGGMFRLLGAGASAVGSVATATAGVAGSVAAGVASGATAVAAPKLGEMAKEIGVDMPQIDWRSIKREAKQMLKLNEEVGNKEQTGDHNKQGNNQDSNRGTAVTGGEEKPKMWADKEDVMEVVTKAYGAIRNGNIDNADREDLLSLVSERAGVSKEEANKSLEKWEKTYREAKQKYDAALAQAEQKARNAAEATAKTVSSIAVWTFASLVVGVLVAAVGGYLGSAYAKI